MRYILVTMLFGLALGTLAHGESEPCPDEKVASDGLLLHYDFSRRSLPDTKGRIKDLSPSGINAVIRPTTATPSAVKSTGWLKHHVLQRDGRGGWVSRPAKIQAVRHPTAKMTMPFGLVRMDNGLSLIHI